MSAVSARLGFPLLSAGQAQKELFHNEALQSLDILVTAAVEEPPRTSPPAGPSVGATYVVANNPTGDWAGKQLCLACCTSGGWRFISPRDGMTAYVKSTSVWAAFRNGGWELGTLRGSALFLGGQQVVGTRSGAIASPSGGTTVDAEARGAVTQILAALRQHGLIES